MTKIEYWHDIMIGRGWEDIIAMHKITCPRSQHQVRESVLYAQKTARHFEINEWRGRSGFDARIRTVGSRRDRPFKANAESRSERTALLARN